jgi:hypothetical protein
MDALSVLNVISNQTETEGKLSPIREKVWEESTDHFMANPEQDEQEYDAVLELLALESSKNQSQLSMPRLEPRCVLCSMRFGQNLGGSSKRRHGSANDLPSQGR